MAKLFLSGNFHYWKGLDIVALLNWHCWVTVPRMLILAALINPTYPAHGQRTTSSSHGDVCLCEQRVVADGHTYRRTYQLDKDFQLQWFHLIWHYTTSELMETWALCPLNHATQLFWWHVNVCGHVKKVNKLNSQNQRMSYWKESVL